MPWLPCNLFVSVHLPAYAQKVDGDCGDIWHGIILLVITIFEGLSLCSAYPKKHVVESPAHSGSLLFQRLSSQPTAESCGLRLCWHPACT